MPRFTLQGWWCICGQKNSPDARKCSKCQFNRFQRTAQVSVQERAVVYHNPATGEHRTPPRNDMPIPENYKRAGFERREIFNMSQFEKEANVVHEATSFNPGNEPVPERYPTPHISKEKKDALIMDMRDAIASGPWTGGLPDSV